MDYNRLTIVGASMYDSCQQLLINMEWKITNVDTILIGFIIC